MKKLSTAVSFIGVSKKFDGWIEKLLPEKTEKLYLSDTGHDENPHIWLSLSRAGDIARKAAMVLGRLDSRNSGVFEKNLRTYLEKLAQTDREIRGLFEPIPRKKIIEFHPAWDYFAADYGISITAAIQEGHGKSPSIKKIAGIISDASAAGTRVIVADQASNDRSVEAVAAEIHGRVILLDTMGNPGDEKKSTYLKLMKYNAGLLSGALKKDNIHGR